MPGGVEAFQTPAFPGQHVTVVQRDVGGEVPVAGLLLDRRCLAAGPAGVDRRVRAETQDRRARRCGQSAGGGGVVAVGVGHADVRDGPALQRSQQRRHVGGVVGPRVDDCDLGAADDVGAGAGEGERAGVGCRDPLHKRCDLHRCSVGGVVVCVEQPLQADRRSATPGGGEVRRMSLFSHGSPAPVFQGDPRDYRSGSDRSFTTPARM